MKAKVLLIMQGGIIQNIIANCNSVEIIKLEDEKDSPATLGVLPIDEELTEENFSKKVHEEWKKSLEAEFRHTTNVDVAEGGTMAYEFRGVADPKTFFTQPDGSITVDVEDMDGDWFTVDIQNITLPD